MKIYALRYRLRSTGWFKFSKDTKMHGDIKKRIKVVFVKCFFKCYGNCDGIVYNMQLRGKMCSFMCSLPFGRTCLFWTQRAFEVLEY